VAEAVGEVGEPRLLGHAVGAQPFLPHQEVTQDRFRRGQQRVGGGDAAAGQAQASLIDQGPHRILFLRAVLPVHPQEEDALDRVHPPRVVQQLVEGAVEVGPDKPAEVLLRRQQPVRVPVAGLREEDDTLGVIGDAETPAQGLLAFSRWRLRRRPVDGGFGARGQVNHVEILVRRGRERPVGPASN
jgi:hypothetical protein